MTLYKVTISKTESFDVYIEATGRSEAIYKYEDRGNIGGEGPCLVQWNFTHKDSIDAQEAPDGSREDTMNN